MSILKANEARKQKALDKLYRFSVGLKSFRQMIDDGTLVRGEVADVPKLKYCRAKYNRMNYTEQAEYERGMEETKKEYRLFFESGSFVDCPKMVYEYFEEFKNSAKKS